MNYVQTLPPTSDDSLLDNLSPADFLQYGRTCTTAYYTVKSYIQRRFQVHQILAPYFTDGEIMDFRTLQYTTGMFISGSTALQFFARTYYPNADLDLYLEHRYRKEVAKWLVDIGYQYHPKGNIKSLEHALELDDKDETTEFHVQMMQGMPQETKGYISAKMVLDFEKQEPYRKIQLITSYRSAFERLLNFHSTCVMNLITYDKAYCLYPLGTLEERRSLTFLRQFEPTEKRIRDKYVARGFELLNQITRDEFDNPYSAFARGERYVGDDRCWTLDLPFDYNNLELLRLRTLELNMHQPMEINGWELRYDTTLSPTIRYDLLVTPKLRFQYTFVSDEGTGPNLSSLISEFWASLDDKEGHELIFDGKLECLLFVWRKFQKEQLLCETISKIVI